MAYDDLKARAVSKHIWLFREGDASTQGTTPTSGLNAAGAGVAGELYLPKSDEANWISSGDIETWEDTIAQDEEKEVRRAVKGSLARKDIITIFQGMDMKFTINSVPRIAVEAFYRTSTKLSDAARQFVPLQIPPRKYWIMVTGYDNENNPILAFNLWARVKISGGIKGGNGEIVMPEYTARILDSALNTQAFGDLSDLFP
jgi:hypothetical protein